MDIKLGNNEAWTVKFVSKPEMPAKTWGDCNNKTKTIRVRTDLCGLNFLDTFIHEMLHASNYVCFSEEFVEQTATQMAKALIKSGLVVVPPQD